MTGPSMEHFSDPGFGSGGGKMYAAGTLEGSGRLRVMELNVTSLRWTALPSGAFFGIRNWPSIVYSQDSVYVFGGVLANVDCDNTLFELVARDQEWTIYTGAIQGVIPSSRSFSRFATLDSLYLLGGIDGLELLSSELFQFDPRKMRWIPLNASGLVPTPRSKFGFTSCFGHLCVFGGATASGPSNDLYRLNMSNYRWENLSNSILGTIPSPRKDHDMTCVQGRLFVFGGKTGNDMYGDFLGDFYILDTTSTNVTWVTPSRELSGDVPSARYAHGLTSTADKIYLFGGLTVNEGLSNQVFEFNPATNIWVDLTLSLSGDTISPRMWSSVAASGSSIFIFGGLSESGNGLNDFFRIQVRSREILDISELVHGSPPSNRFGHAAEVFDSKLWILGGNVYTNHGGTSYQNDRFRFISLPNDFSWPANGSSWGFLNIYDWDEILLDEKSVSIMMQKIQLCTGVFPCFLSLRSTGGLIYRSGGYFSCLASDGCLGIIVHSVTFTCDPNKELPSLFDVRGSRLEITNSSFSRCRSNTDGVIIRTNSGSFVRVGASIFSRLHTTGYGGAIASIEAIYIFLTPLLLSVKAMLELVQFGQHP